MDKFKLEKLIDRNKPESVKHIIEIIAAAGLDKSVEVIRRAVTVADLKAAGKIDGEPTIEKGSRIFPIWVTTRDIDRDKEIVMPRGISLRDWQKSAVIIRGHDYSSLPIGKAVWVGVSDYGIKMHIEAAPTADGEEILALSRFMPLTASIGMGGVEYARAGSPEFDKITRKMLADWQEFSEKTLAELGGVIVKCTLLEVSIVSVPANPNAVQTQLAKSAISGDGLTDDEKEIVRKVFRIEAEPTPGSTKTDGDGDDVATRLKQVEGEVRDLKAKCEQLIQERTDMAVTLAETEARLKAVVDAKRIERMHAVEVIESKHCIEVIGKSADIEIEAHVKRAVDLNRGRV
jgi:hypothetical protein